MKSYHRIHLQKLLKDAAGENDLYAKQPDAKYKDEVASELQEILPAAELLSMSPEQQQSYSLENGGKICIASEQGETPLMY